MPTNRPKPWTIVLFAALLALAWSPVPPAQAGPIGDLIAKHRQNKAMRLPPISKPFSTEPVKDISPKKSILAQRFKQRFQLKRGGATDGSAAPDQGVVRTSR
jgi:hypothetical protein